MVEHDCRDPPYLEIVNKEHVEHKVVQSSGGIFPSNDIGVRLLDLCDGASFGEKSFDSVHIFHKNWSVKLGFWNLI